MRLSKVTALKSMWFDLPDDPDKARFQFTLLTPKQDREIDAKAQKFISSDSGSEFELDHVTAGHLRPFAALTDCQNVYLTQDTESEEKMTPALKRRLFDEVPGFGEWALSCYGKLREQYLAEQEAERKNLSS